MPSDIPRVPYTPTELESALLSAIVEDARSNGEFPWSDAEVEAFAQRVQGQVLAADPAGVEVTDDADLIDVEYWLLLEASTTATRGGAVPGAGSPSDGGGRSWKIKDPATRTSVEVLPSPAGWRLFVTARAATGPVILSVRFRSGRVAEERFVLTDEDQSVLDVPGVPDDLPVAVRLAFGEPR